MGRGFDLLNIIENRVSYISIYLKAGTFLFLLVLFIFPLSLC